MTQSKLLIPEHYKVYMQNLTTPYLELTRLGFVDTIHKARTMVAAFRKAFTNNQSAATVFFQHKTKKQ